METKLKRAERRKNRVRTGLAKEGYRLSISRSNRFLFAQIIDQKTGKTILGLTDKKILPEIKGKTKIQLAREFGNVFAQEVLKQKIKKVIFDRGQFRFHGRVKAFVEGTKAAGLEY